MRGKISDRVNPKVSKWSRYTECMDEEQMTKRVFEPDKKCKRYRNRHCSRWFIGIEFACDPRSLELRDANVEEFL